MAGDSQDAFHFVQDFKFDLVLIKLALLDMDGNALIRRVRMAKLDTPIIALSSVPQARLKALAAAAGTEQGGLRLTAHYAGRHAALPTLDQLARPPSERTRGRSGELLIPSAQLPGRLLRIAPPLDRLSAASGFRP